MTDQDRDFQSAQEIGKIYYSITDKETLSIFVLESILKLIPASQGFLYLAGREEKVWLSANTEPSKDPAPGLESEAQDCLAKGKPVVQRGFLFLPLIARSSAIGIACYSPQPGKTFTEHDLNLGFGLASQAAGALKNLLLFEENLKMEKLAAVGQTISMVTHEIKNIMQIAKLSNDFIKSGLKDKDEQFVQRGLTEMSRALQEMDGFVWDMLNLTKDHKLVTQKIALTKIIDELRNDFLPKSQDRKMELDFKVEEGFPMVDADGRAIYRTLFNLIKNAIEASSDGGWVRVRVNSTDEKMYEITVQDNGQGMSPEVKAKIFQAFFSTKGGAGTGLGLMIIDQTVKRHKGKIRVESEVGKGTQFTLTLTKSIAVETPAVAVRQ